MSVLQRVAVCCSVLRCVMRGWVCLGGENAEEGVCCSVLLCVAVCCSASCDAGHISEERMQKKECAAMCVAVCCCVL